MEGLGELPGEDGEDWLSRLGWMFYIASPSRSSFRTVHQVPQIFRQAWPYFLVFIFLENVILWLEKKPLMRVNDGITSLSHGLIQELGRVVWRGGEGALYVWVHERWRIAELPWDSPLTWYLAAIGVDFCYYWLHRASHEVHLLWAQHQVHHSSEDYNLAVGLRQSLVQGWCGFLFYLPLALVVPPAHFLAHQQFQLLYQFWIHTETVGSLGPLEWLLNTPTHHRIHHGSTLYCLDKNYGGTLIVWDRLFGTFAEERPDQEMVYGLVMNQPSFNPFYLQTFYNLNVWNKMKSMEGFKNKCFAVVKGPSWMPGRSWTGAQEDKIDVKSRPKFDVELPLWANLYLILHFAAVLLSYQDLAHRYVSLSPVVVFTFLVYILVSLTMIGLMLEGRPNILALEAVRCTILATLLQRNALVIHLPFLKWFFAFSILFWLFHYIRVLKVAPPKEKSV